MQPDQEPLEAVLVWKKIDGYQEASLGPYGNGDGVRFTLSFYLTCYRRGKWRLLIEVCGGPNHEKWGCFDEADQPMRWFHSEQNAKSESQLIANVLVADRIKHGPLSPLAPEKTHP